MTGWFRIVSTWSNNRGVAVDVESNGILATDAIDRLQTLFPKAFDLDRSRRPRLRQRLRSSGCWAYLLERLLVLDLGYDPIPSSVTKHISDNLYRVFIYCVEERAVLQALDRTLPLLRSV